MLLQITWQARKKVVPLVPVIATSHETRSERIILSYIGINTDTTQCRGKSNKPKSLLRSNVQQLDETIHEIKPWSHHIFRYCPSGFSRRIRPLLQPAGRSSDGVNARCTHAGNRNRKPHRGFDHGRDKIRVDEIYESVREKLGGNARSVHQRVSVRRCR